MARKPNYDFERREREKAKAAKTAERVKLKTEAAERAKSEAEQAAQDPGSSNSGDPSI